MTTDTNLHPHAPFSYHDIVDVTIETLTNLGLGLGRVDGWVVMVPFTIPGERVKVRIYRNHKNYSDADLLEVLKPSADRAQPQCPLFGTCGGCQYQHMSYEAQLAWKTDQVRNLLRNIPGAAELVKPAIGSPKTYHYRSKLTPHYPRPKKEDTATLPIGFLKQGTTHSIIDVPQCPIATEAINEALPKLRSDLRNKAATFKRGGTLLVRHSREGVTQDSQAIISEQIGSWTYQFLAGEFFQNNPYILPSLLDYAIAQASGQEARYLIDAYCGVGVFAIAGSAHFERYMGIEVNANAIRWARGNAGINNASNGDFVIGEAQHIFAEVTFPGEDTALIIDPPRQGCSEEFVKQANQFGAKTIVYVSCDPATQVRDLAWFQEGGYELRQVQPFDLFPQTRHIESVATLVRR